MIPKVYRPRLYFASKLRHAPLWRSLRDGRLSFCNVHCSWIDTPEVEALDKTAPPARMAEIWTKDLAEAFAADFTLLYYEEGDELKGARVECGATLASGGCVIVIGRLEDSWTWHPRVVKTDSLFFDDAILILQRHTRKKQLP